MLPNFLIIGSAKSGTTSLWSYLDAHPDVFLPRQKELNFFSSPEWRSRIDWYESQFAGASEPLRGEASVYYSMHPFKPGVAGAIAETLPDVKLIYLVREPIERLVSHYVQNVSSGFEQRTLDEALSDLSDPANEYVCGSRYATQLHQYRRHFDARSLLVVEQEELLRNRWPTLERIYRFIGADPSFKPATLETLANTRARKMRTTSIGHRVNRSRLAGAVRRLPDPVAGAIVGVMRRILFRPIDRAPRLKADLRGALEDLLLPEVDELRAMTGQALPSLTPANTA